MAQEQLKLAFGDGAITEAEWKALQKLLEDTDAHTVLEIGSGYSTILLAQAGYKVFSLETHSQWAARVSAELPENGHVMLVTYPDLPQLSRRYDVAFVDGPAGGSTDGRKAAMHLAHEVADVVVIHDAEREAEKQARSEVFGGWAAHDMAGRLVWYARQKERKARDAIFFAVTPNYAEYGNCLIESLERMGCEADIFGMAYGDVEVDSGWWHDLEPHMLDEPGKDALPMSGNLRVKHARYAAMAELAAGYEVVCLLDADMLVVAPEFWGLFDLVRGTRKAIGCNEAFKWTYDERHQDDDGAPLFEVARRAWAFHCNAPFICSPAEWLPVFQRYNRLAGHAYEQKDDTVKRMGDIFCWNAAVMLEDRESDLLLLPMEMMTQVHHLHLSPERHLVQHGDRWQTVAGDLVYTLHGRPLNKGWLEGELRALGKYPATSEKDATARLEAVREFWCAHLTASPPPPGGQDGCLPVAQHGAVRPFASGETDER